MFSIGKQVLWLFVAAGAALIKHNCINNRQLEYWRVYRHLSAPKNHIYSFKFTADIFITQAFRRPHNTSIEQNPPLRRLSK